MLSVKIQIGARVRRKNDNGMDAPGAVMRLNDAEAMVYWPQDNYYEVVRVGQIEPYGAIPNPA
jgi:hypothetical protein